MKRLITLILCICLIGVSIPFSVSANEADTERDRLVATACEVFPEYASKITHSPENFKNRARNSEARELVHNETRKVSDNQFMTYSEYSDGVVLLSSSNYRYSTVQNGQETSGQNTTVTITITAACNIISGSFKLTNARYTISRNGYDRIDSAGTMSIVEKCYMHTTYTPIWNETASQKARIAYRLSWYLGPDPGDYLCSVVSLKVGNNGAIVAHVDYDDYTG